MAHDKIATRLAQIIIKLNNGESLSIDELVDEFGVCKRTIERDLEKLNVLPIERDKDRLFLADYALGKLGFKDIQNFAALIGMKSLFPKLDSMFITDILNEKLNVAYLVKNQGFENLNITRGEFDAISAAIIKSWIIECIYNDKPRTLKPYKLINNNGIWYLLADENSKLKNFTVSKLKNLKFTEKVFRQNDEFIKRIAQNNSNWFSNENFDVELKIKKEAIDYFKRRQILPNYKIIFEDETSITISTKVAYDDEILRVVKYWIPFIKIVSPVKLKEKFENILKKYLDI